MITSTIEAYPKECLGTLFGRRTQQAFTVEYAFPYQTAKRTTFRVEVDDKAEKCIHSTLQNLTSLRHIGNYHSHILGGTKLTSIDKREENLSLDEISVVIAISKKKRKAHWRNHRKRVSGALGNFGFDIVAYTCYSSKRQIRKFRKIDIMWHSSPSDHKDPDNT